MNLIIGYYTLYGVSDLRAASLPEEWQYRQILPACYFSQPYLDHTSYWLAYAYMSAVYSVKWPTQIPF